MSFEGILDPCLKKVHEKEKERLESGTTNLRTIRVELEVIKYEKKQLELLVGEAKLMQEEGSANACITELRK